MPSRLPALLMSNPRLGSVNLGRFQAFVFHQVALVDWLVIFAVVVALIAFVAAARQL